MPLYEYECQEGHREEHWFKVSERDKFGLYCAQCNDFTAVLKRLPGGHGMLYFEEGRGRIHSGLSDKPITSPAQHARLMRQYGVVEAGNELPPGIKRKGPKSEAMKRHLDKKQG